MTRLRPELPYDPEETPISWATRLAALHTGESVVPFLHDIGIPTGDIRVNRESAIQRLCDLTGQDLELVRDNMVHVLAWRSYSYRGHAFSAEFLQGTETKFCPACLAEDDAQGRRPALDRKGRTIWLFRPVRTCPRHKIALMSRPDVEWHHFFKEMAIRVPERGRELASLVETRPTRDTSPLQDYVLSRFDGQAGPEWLDGQSVEQAVKATEMIGVVLAFGPKPNLKELTSDEWDTAGQAGFDYTRRGKDGIHDALNLLSKRQIISGGHVDGKHGPQAIFGRLYQWLEFNKNKKDPGPIREIMFDHILQTQPIPPGKRLLGKTINKRVRHSVMSLAKATSTHPKTVRNLLVAKGLIAADEKANGLVSVDADASQELMASLIGAIPRTRLPEALNTTRGQCIMLLENGHISCTDHDVQEPGMHRGLVTRQVIDDFLARVLRHATVVEVQPDGVEDIARASQLSKVLTNDILNAVIAGSLTRIFKIASIPGYGGVRVDPVEVKRMLGPSTDQPDVPAYMIARRLGYPLPAVNFLLEPKEGQPLLAWKPGLGAAKKLVSLESADAFARDHVTLTGLSREVGIRRKLLLRKLKEAGVPTIGDPEEIKIHLYRRDQIRLI
jgi:hypothetical protein